MTKFIKYILLWFLLVFVLLEVTLRLFDLSAKTMPTVNLNNDYVFKPYSSGTWVRGGLAEIDNYYRINNLGYNSIIEYEEINQENLNIAIIGDSYIQGFQTDVKKSIGRQLEDMLDSYNAVVHEFGRAGANIVDYQKVYEKYIYPKNYDYVFVLITDKDLKQYKPSYMERGNRVPKKALSREIYDFFYVFRYLNINQGVGIHFNKLISNGPESFERINRENTIITDTTKEDYFEKINVDVIEKLPDNIIFLYEEGKLSHHFIDNFDFNFIEIDHKLKPYNHGFDSHWNIIGRKNCAASIVKYIKQNPIKISQTNEVRGSK
jgi:hypothetical protein